MLSWGQRKKGQCHYHGHTVGDMVWLEGANLKLTHPKSKLDAKRYGPFPITKEVSPVVFQLALLLWFYSSALNALGSLPRPSAPAVAAAAAATVTPAVAALVRAHFRWLHRIHQTGGPHGY
jgi:hypothetical protein